MRFIYARHKGLLKDKTVFFNAIIKVSLTYKNILIVNRKKLKEELNLIIKPLKLG
jgi:hypothetical protein